MWGGFEASRLPPHEASLCEYSNILNVFWYSSMLTPTCVVTLVSSLSGLDRWQPTSCSTSDLGCQSPGGLSRILEHRGWRSGLQLHRWGIFEDQVQSEDRITARLWRPQIKKRFFTLVASLKERFVDVYLQISDTLELFINRVSLRLILLSYT